MFDRSDIKAAQDAGILTKDQASRFEAFLAARADPATPVATDAAEYVRYVEDLQQLLP